MSTTSEIVKYSNKDIMDILKYGVGKNRMLSPKRRSRSKKRKQKKKKPSVIKNAELIDTEDYTDVQKYFILNLPSKIVMKYVKKI